LPVAVISPTHMVRIWLNSTIARPPAATSRIPSVPISTMLVVDTAICASWVIAIGVASAVSRRLSAR
jgi:hypothetical protein